MYVIHTRAAAFSDEAKITSGVSAQGRLVSRMRRVGVVAAAAVAASLAVIGLPGGARADTTTGYDQMTGVGPTASAVTVPWTQGLLDNTNTPIASANADRSSANPTSPVSFMYYDFKNLVVTVSQTSSGGRRLTRPWPSAPRPATRWRRAAPGWARRRPCWRRRPPAAASAPACWALT